MIHCINDLTNTTELCSTCIMVTQPHAPRYKWYTVSTTA